MPTVVLGNLDLGGTGKTPHALLILRLLEARNPALLSRGYGRDGEGTLAVCDAMTAREAGDEPLLIARRMPHIPVVCDADRLRGLHYITKQFPTCGVAVLDDALQHRRLRGGLYILLTTWEKPFYRDHVLPAGSLRDSPVRARDVQAVVVTKTPPHATAAQKEGFRQMMAYLKVPVFFSAVAYGALLPANEAAKAALVPTEGSSVVLLTGIARPEPFARHEANHFQVLRHFSFSDHHRYSTADIQRLSDFIGSFAPSRPALITTEKDAMRLMGNSVSHALGHIPIWYREIDIQLGDDLPALEQLLNSYLKHA